MRVLILGFGPLAREITHRVKHFPEYGFDNKISIYHIFTRRNSLSYGKNLVVEIPDPHGDGYRTYKDGFQALENYSTTVSNYVPWLLEEAKNGSFHVVINCMSKNKEADDLEDQLKNSMPSDHTWIAANNDGDVDSVVHKLRLLIDGGSPWSPAEYSAEFMSEAERLWQEADIKMKELHLMKRAADVENYGHPDRSMAKTGYAQIDALPSFDLNILDRFVINDEYHCDYKPEDRNETYDKNHDCTIIEHSLLTSFFGWHHLEAVACRSFGTPKLEIESAKYVRYESDDSTHVAEEKSDYVIEFVYKGKLKVLPTKPPLFSEYGQPHDYLVFEGGSPNSSYSYSPPVNPPQEKLVEKGLETIIFTFREASDDN